jgi:hypothetical protein
VARAEDGVDRREFLRTGVLAGLGMGLLPSASPLLAAELPQVRRYVPLGRTGLRISDIGFGSAELYDDVGIVHHALERGINYFDTAEIYNEGGAERTLGRALKGQRERVVLTSKVMAQAGDTRESMMRALEGSLERLQTDHVDIYMNHAVNNLERLKNPEWFEFVERAKEQGKIRFSGMSGHGANLIECLNYAFDHDLFDVVLSAYNFADDPDFRQRVRILIQSYMKEADWVATLQEIPETLAKGKRKGVGIICMKTLRGGRINDLRRYETGGATFAQAALRRVLSNPSVDALIVSMPTRAHVDEFLVASGWAREQRGDLALLERYEAENGSSQCRYGCRLCSSACPEGVPIPEVLRARMYERDYGDARLARREYAQLLPGASKCLECSHQSCTGACPFGIEIEKLTGETHRLLSGD